MLLIAPVIAVPLLVAVAISAVLSEYLDRDWAGVIALTVVFLLVPFCMTAAFRLAKRYANHWPFS
jgi:hypothetical protein